MAKTTTKTKNKPNMKQNLLNKVKEDYEKRDRGGVQAKQYLKLENGATLYKPKTGKNAIDIIPFQYKTNLFGNKGDYGYMIDLYVHKNFNQSFDKCVCLKKNFGKPCPVCELRDQLTEMDEDKYEDTINSYKPKRRAIYNVINLKEDEEDEKNGEVQILDEVYFFFQKELIEESCADDAGDPVDFVDPEEGMSVFFRATSEKLGSAKFHRFKSFTFEERDEQYDMDFVHKNAFSLDSLIHIPTYEEVEAMLNEESLETEEDEDEPDDNDDDDEGESEVETEDEDIDTDDSEDIDDEEEVEVSKPKPKAKAKAKSQSKTKTKAKPKATEDDDEDEDIEMDEETDDDSDECPYDKTFGEDGDVADPTCLKCKKTHPDTFKNCIVASL